MSVGSAQAAERDRADEARQVGQVSEKVSGFGSDTQQVRASDALTGAGGRGLTISRGAARLPIGADSDQAATEKAAAKRAKARAAALERLAEKSDQRAEELRNRWVLPLDSYRLTATFGEGGALWSANHTGLDFAAPYGSPIKAVAHGIVTSVGYAGAYGNQTVITHADGTQTSYSHMSSSAVSTGEEVEAGEVVGYVGMTGNTTGPHLHFEVLPYPDTPVDPYGALVEHGISP